MITLTIQILHVRIAITISWTIRVAAYVMSVIKHLPTLLQIWRRLFTIFVSSVIPTSIWRGRTLGRNENAAVAIRPALAFDLSDTPAVLP